MPVANPREDSLNLNLATPAERTNAKLPVIVTCHGGGLTFGSANMDLLQGLGLASHDVVTVNVNARLGPLGYLALPELSAESPEGISGNHGTLDMIQALAWVKQNIARFGEDPYNVTIAGESGGGSKAYTLMAAPQARGLFPRAIVQSGGFAPEKMLAQAEAAGRAVLQQLGITDGNVLQQLRARPWQDMLDAAKAANYVTGPTIDGVILRNSMQEAFEAVEQAPVPIVVGANSAENLQYPGVTNIAELVAKSGQKAYVYVFSLLPSNWRDELGLKE